MAEIILAGEPQRAYAKKFIDGLDLSKKWTVKVEPHKKKRSLSQNALYHKWLSVISEDTGYSNDEVHELMKRKFLEPKMVEMGGESIQCWTTTSLDPKSMSEFMNKVEAFANSQLGVILPSPHDNM